MLQNVQAYFKNHPGDWKLEWPGKKKRERNALISIREVT